MATAKVISRTVKKLLYRRSFSNFARPETLWTPDNIVISPYKPVELPTTTITEHVWKDIEKWSDKTALVCGVTNRSYTYHQLFKYSRNLAANMRTKLSITDSDVVCVMMHNSPEYVLSVIGTLEAGAVLTTVNPIYTAHEVYKQLLLSEPKIVIVSPETVKVMKDAIQLYKKNIQIILVNNSGEALPEGTISLQEIIQDCDHSVLKNVKRNAEDVAILPYSSGTTGLPKGVELTNRNIVVNCLQQDIKGMKLHEDTTSWHQESILGVLPFYHIYGLVVVMMHKLSVGCKVVTLPKFQPDIFLTALQNYRVTLLFAAPPMVLFLGSYPGVNKGHIESIKKIMSGAAPLHREDIDKVLRIAKPDMDIIQIYGLTETSPLVSGHESSAANYKSSGFAVSNTELMIVKDSKILGANEIGELWIRGPQVMKGYRNNLEATKAAITEEGWFKSGDLAAIDSNGEVTITDRLKELIKVKGYQVPPAELENVIKQHSKVQDAGVIGIPDPKTGEAPKAFVVLKEGQEANAKDIQDFVKERVADFKRVKEVVFMESLPKNPSGKLLRRVLKEL